MRSNTEPMNTSKWTIAKTSRTLEKTWTMLCLDSIRVVFGMVNMFVKFVRRIWPIWPMLKVASRYRLTLHLYPKGCFTEFLPHNLSTLTIFWYKQRVYGSPNTTKTSLIKIQTEILVLNVHPPPHPVASKGSQLTCGKILWSRRSESSVIAIRCFFGVQNLYPLVN